MKTGLLGKLGMVGILALVAGAVYAQTGSTSPTRPHGMLDRIRHPFGHGRTASQGHGTIIGNKNTKVYHLATEKGTLPEEKNRVYFMTEGQARAAGYHAARQSLGGRRSTRGGSFGPGHGDRKGHGMSGSGQNGNIQH